MYRGQQDSTHLEGLLLSPYYPRIIRLLSAPPNNEAVCRAGIKSQHDHGNIIKPRYVSPLRQSFQWSYSITSSPGFLSRPPLVPARWFRPNSKQQF